VGRGTIGVGVEPRMVAQPAADDHGLVAAVRGGDDRAFAALYQRYQRRIAAYVLGMVKDHGRAEDVTQEVFVSALRRIRETERPIAFKPWIYEIAKNACIDQFRRSRRAEEISFDAEEGLTPADYRRLVGPDPTPDAAVAAKQELDTLCGAFGGISDTHHEILVLRELEGLSYREIGERMGLSRPAVESTLFRARRRLTEEYDDLVTGARCERIHRVIQATAGGRLGARESRRLARHVAHCQPCRREALAAGLDEAILTHVPLRRRAAARIASLLPLPGLVRFARGPDAPAASLAGPGGPGWVAQLPALSDQLSGGWAKLATAATVVVAGLGAAGVGTQHEGDRDAGTRDRAEHPAIERPDAAGRRVAAIRPPAAAPAKPAASREKRRPARSRARTARRSSSAAGTSTPAAAAPTTPPAAGPAPEPAATAPRSEGTGPAAGAPVSKPKVPPVTTPTGSDPVAPVVNTVQQTTAPVTGPVAGTVDQVTDTVDRATGGATQPLTDTVDRTVGGLVP
jgi:RNA polymerase sigma factor (sigma-70 family)